MTFNEDTVTLWHQVEHWNLPISWCHAQIQDTSDARVSVFQYSHQPDTYETLLTPPNAQRYALITHSHPAWPTNHAGDTQETEAPQMYPSSLSVCSSFLLDVKT